MNMEDIRRMAEVPSELSGWRESEPFRCILRRPSMHRMVASGTVPNPLIPTIERLFTATVPRELTAEDRMRESEALLAIAREALAEPAMAALEEAGVCLTDDQLMEIYAFAVAGPRGLDSFRRGARGGAGGDEPADGGKAKRASGRK